MNSSNTNNRNDDYHHHHHSSVPSSSSSSSSSSCYYKDKDQISNVHIEWTNYDHSTLLLLITTDTPSTTTTATTATTTSNYKSTSNKHYNSRNKIPSIHSYLKLCFISKDMIYSGNLYNYWMTNYQIISIPINIIYRIQYINIDDSNYYQHYNNYNNNRDDKSNDSSSNENDDDVDTMNMVLIGEFKVIMISSKTASTVSIRDKSSSSSSSSSSSLSSIKNKGDARYHLKQYYKVEVIWIDVSDI